MFCVKCGKQVKEDTNFCAGCGHQVEKLDIIQQEPIEKEVPTKLENNNISLFYRDCTPESNMFRQVDC